MHVPARMALSEYTRAYLMTQVIDEALSARSLEAIRLERALTGILGFRQAGERSDISVSCM